MKKLLIFTIFLSFFLMSCDDDNGKKVTDSDTVTDADALPDDDNDIVEPDDDVEPSNCIKLSLEGIKPASQYASTYGTHYTPNTGSEAEDVLMIEFTSPITYGEFDLGSGRNANYGTCEQCILLSEDRDENGIAKRFFQESGKLVLSNVITDESGYMTAESKGYIAKVKLVEVTLESGTLNSIPVENGKCYEIEFADWNSLTTQPDCANKECGDDGAGGICGTCETGNICNNSGQCITCTPQCDGKVCGDDGCGGTCGSCQFGSTCGSDGSKCVQCTEITLKEEAFTAPSVNYVATSFTPEIGENSKTDEFRIEFNNKQLFKDVDINLAEGLNGNYQTCEQCLLVLQDFEDGTASKTYFQSAGTLNIDEMVLWPSGLMKSQSRGIMKNVMLEEVTINDSKISTPVQNGSCIVIKEAEWDTMCYPSCKNEDGSAKVCGSDGCGGICGTACGVGKVCNEEQSACVDRVCEKISVEETKWNDLYEAHEYYIADVSPELGRETDEENGHWGDQLRLEFKPDVKTLGKGIYDLASEENIQAKTCKTCVTLAVDPWDDQKKYFFQEAGTLTIDELGEKGSVTGTLSNVRLIEVTLKAASGNTDLSTPVPGGECYLIETASFSTICTPQCEGKVCGDDGCGGTCGTCGDGKECSDDQTICEKICTEITLNEVTAEQDFMWRNIYSTSYTPNTGAADEDRFEMMFENSITKGDCDMSNSASCFSFFKITEDGTKTFIPQSGTVTLEDFNPDAYGAIALESKGYMSNVVLSEVDSDNNFVSDGECLKIVSATWNTYLSCTPECNGKVCGNDGCGGTCGTCSENETCSSDGTSCLQPVTCEDLSIPAITKISGSATESIYRSEFTQAGNTEKGDIFEMKINEASAGSTYDLMSTENTNYYYCKQCVELRVDSDTDNKLFIPANGSLRIDEVNADDLGSSKGELLNVKVVEAELIYVNPYDFMPTPVAIEGGACYNIKGSTTWNTMP